MNLEFHPVANIFPLLEGQEYDDLKSDIIQNGLIEPIWLHPDGRIIDGRNRYRACNEAGVEPKFEVWDKQGSLVYFVLSLNLHRRHLTSSQQAAVGAEIEPMLAKEARERQATSEPGIYGGKPLKEKIPYPVEKGQARDQAAAILHTNGRYVQDAKKFKQEAPDIFEQVKNGKVTIPDAKRLARMPQNTKTRVIEKLETGEAQTVVEAARQVIKESRQDPSPLTGKYRVLYADPPWKYGNSGLDEYGHAERHYPSMSIDELCAMGDEVREISEDDAVMFMWVTSPFLEDCFKVIRAWGFKYKTSFIWDKVKHNFGYYNSVRHEFLLVCVKGSCTPDVNKLFDSVQSIERSSQHSEKPEFFREIIDTIYTKGEKIELFARRQVDGWQTWGNEL